MSEFFTQLGQQIADTSWIEWTGAATAIAGVWLTIREHAAAWPFFLVCYGCYAWLSIEASLYAAFLMQIVFIVLSVYGWYKWTIGSRGAGEAGLRVARTPARLAGAAAGCWLLGAVLIGAALRHYSGSFLPFADAFATTGGFIAQWMLGRKYIETWLCWIVSDIVFLWLWTAQGYLVTTALYTVFIFLAVRGWREWKRSTPPTPA